MQPLHEIQRQETLLSRLAAASVGDAGITFVEASEREEFLSYRDLRDESLVLLGRLQALGARPGNEVVFQLRHNRDFLVAFWASLLGGLIPVPLAVGANDEHRRKVFLVWRRLNAPILLADTAATFESLRDNAEALGEADLIDAVTERLLLLDAPVADVPAPVLVDASPDDIALVQFSSGSTGIPKGVIVTHRAAIVNTTDMIRRLRVERSDRYLSWMPLTHDFGIIGMHLTPLVAGIDQYQLPTQLFIRNPMLWLRKTHEHRATMLASPNFGYRHFLKFYRPEAAAAWDLSCVRLIQNGAEPISPSLCREFLDTLRPLGLRRESMLPGYGLAEATLAVAYAGLDEEVIDHALDRSSLGLAESIVEVDTDEEGAVHFVDIGFAVDSMEIRITDAGGIPLREKKIGRIEIRGESVTPGYYNDPEATRRAISDDGWLDTGDLGFMMNGRLTITGRAKDIIFVGGVNYYPHDIERVATGLAEIDVNKIAVCGFRNDREEREEVAAFIYFKGTTDDFAMLAERVKEHVLREVGLALDYVLPVAAIPKTTSGKVQRFALAESLRRGEFDSIVRRLDELRAERTARKRNETLAALAAKGREEVARRLRAAAEEVIGGKIDDDDRPFADYGFDSVRGVAYRDRIAGLFGLELPVSAIFDYPNVRALADHVAAKVYAAPFEDRSEPAAPGIGDEREEIAVIGIGCRLPGGVDSFEDFLKLLADERDTVGAAPSWRWNGDNDFTTWRGAFVGDVDRFDNVLFSIAPNEAEGLDPQQRFLLETSWRALEHAGLSPASLRGRRVGVFVGISASDYARRWEGDAAGITPYSLTGTMASTAAGRLSYVFGFTGPSLSVDTACSSSLVALHLGVESLRRGESECVLAGGVNLILDSSGYVALERLGALAPDGSCKTFDESADGYGRGEGCGVLVLKRLGDALRDGDTIHAVVSGSAVNHDGRSNGLTAPNGVAQERVVAEALRDAGVRPEDVGYVEAHGTGTALGDPQEVHALDNVYGAATRTAKLVVGSVKSNIGHLESAAGVAGVIKAIAVLREGRFFRSIHCDRPSSRIPWDRLAVEVANKASDWEAGETRRAGVSSFGLSGTNAHVILREHRADPAMPSLEAHPPFTLPISAAHPDALAASIDAHVNALKDLDGSLLHDYCATAATGRDRLRFGVAVTGADCDTLIVALEKNRAAIPREESTGRLVWMFSGQGSQHRAMARALYTTFPVFREAVDACSALFEKPLGFSIVAMLYGEDEREIDETINAQPAIFTIEYALARLLLSFGIRPELVGGHSIGEFAAACIAEVFSLEEAVTLVAHRAIFMHALGQRGGMLAAFGSEQRVASALNGDPVAIAAVNGPESVVVAGDSDSLDIVARRLRELGITTRPLRVSHAFHSPLMEPVVEKFREIASGIEYGVPTIPFVSSVTGKLIGREEKLDADYWARHIMETVRFADAVIEAERQGARTFLEIGGSAVLCPIGIQSSTTPGVEWIPSQRRDEEALFSLHTALASLYRRGTSIDWGALYPAGSFARIALPYYPFLRNRFWIELKRPAEGVDEAGPIAGGARVAHAGPSRAATAPHRNEILRFLVEAAAEKTGYAPEDLPTDRNVFEAGLDSLVLIALRQKITERFGVEVPNSLLYGSATLNDVAEFVAAEIGETYVETGDEESAAEAISYAGASGGTEIEKIVNRQLDLMEEQLRLLRAAGASEAKGQVARTLSAPGVAAPGVAARNGGSSTGLNGSGDPATKPAFVPYKAIVTRDSEIADEKKRRFLESLIARYTALTKTSKERTEIYRPFFANNRNVAGFRPAWKELIYQLQVDRAEGSRVFDVDGNAFIDLTMGFGVCLFGNNPAFIREAIADELGRGAPVGPMSPIASDIARMLAGLTGIERAAFYNSGTEAVMVSIRLARATTGRDKVVIFSGSYHGTYDGVLALPDGEESALPLAPGIARSVVQDVIVLPYGEQESLNVVRRHGASLAAVLVETVQSRRPDMQPKEFLHELRRITERSGTALIFDEVITGFRISPGGAQRHFGVRADLAVYGKVVGGGMPIGIVAGKAEFMDAVDGGAWSFGDGSVPTKRNTFVAGTFCHHPLAMAATRAVLERMEREGEAICTSLTERTAAFAASLNEFFTSVGAPLRIVHFGSLFRFELSGDWELLFYLLLTKGVYVWEGRNCFFSTAHSDDDIEAVKRAVIEGVLEMIEAGFAPGATVSAKNEPIATDQSVEEASVSSGPMSSTERRMFTLASVPEGELGYHLYNALILEGEIDADRVEGCFRKIVRRHEALRTGYSVVDGEFIRTVHSNVDFRLQHGAIGDDGLDEAMESFVRPFDLSKPPLIRCGLFTAGEGRAFLLIDAHHIACDGIALGTILEELCALYAGETLPPVAAQYRDAVENENVFLQSPERAKQETFWRGILKREAEELRLPTDRTGTGERTYRGGSIYREYPADPLRRLARASGASLYMLTLAAFGAMLKRISGQESFRIGIVHANRRDGRFARTVGMFANSLLFPWKIEQGTSFNRLIAQTKETAVSIYDNYDFPFEHLAGIDRRASRDQRVGFSFEQAFNRTVSIGGLSIAEQEVAKFTSVSDFALDIVEERDRMRLRFDFSADLFDRETAERLAGYFEKLLDAVVADPERSIDDVDLLADEERAFVLGMRGAGRALELLPEPVGLFERAVRENRDTAAILFDGGRMSYAELDAWSSGVAAGIHATGAVGRNEVVAVMLERTPAFVAAVLGVMKTGAAFLMLDPALPDARVEYMLRDADVSRIATASRFAGRPPFAGLRVVDVETVSRDAIQSPSVDPDPEAVAYVIYTSGSTGEPKGVMVSRRNVSNFVAWTNELHFERIGCEVVALHTTPSFDMMVTQLIPTLLSGKTLFVHRPGLPVDKVVEEIFSPETPVEFTTLTPSHVLLLDEIGLERSNVKSVSVGGEALRARHVEILKRLNPEMVVINGYGPTEATVMCIVHIVESPERASVIGRPVANTAAYVLDGSLRPCPVGVAGEICIGGTSVALGYRNKPEQTERSFVESPFVPGEKLYRTGDLGRLLPDGTFEYIGRVDRQVKLFGHRIEPGEIENGLAALHGINGAAVKLVESGGRTILAAWVAAPAGLDVDALRDALAERLPRHMIPATFIVLDTLPLTPNGKVDFAALPDPEIDTEPTGRGGEPRTPIEHAIADAWKSVLRVESLGVDDDFYDLGGDSIKAIQVASRLRKRGYAVDAATVMRYPTITGIVRNLPVDSDDDAAQGSVTGVVPLTPIQRWFFERRMPNPSHWNQELAVRRAGDVDPGVLREALRHVVDHHDALRMRFVADANGEIVQRNLPASGDHLFELSVVDADGATREEREALARDAARRAHAAIDIEHGPLVSAALIRADEESIVVLAIHHLVVDAVSWNPIVEDLLAAITSLERREKVVLPRKTRSFLDRAHALVRYAGSEELLREVPYWEEVEREGHGSLPLPTDSAPTRNTESTTIARSIDLDEEITRLLLRDANSPYRTTTRELLAAALVMALRDWTGEPKRTITFEGHGRDTIDETAGERTAGGSVDRTVGWFTSLYPVVLTAGDTIAETVIGTKERLRRVPRNGIGYGLLRSLASEEVRGDLRFDLSPEILFNYLGNLDLGEGEEANGFSIDVVPLGTAVCPDAPRGERLAIDAFTRGGSLCWTIFYNGEEYRAETIERFLAILRDRLHDVARHCAESKGRVTLSDLEYNGFTGVADLDGFLQVNGIPADEVETIRTLSPMQEGMVFHALTDPTGTAGMAQLAITFRGTVDAALMRRAFRHVLRTYDSLRSAFIWKGAPDVLSVVYRDPEEHFAIVDAEGAGVEERKRFLETDWSSGFVLSNGSLIRMSLVREAADRCTLVWTVHHVITDGWCIGLIFRALLDAYDALRSGHEPTSRIAPSYGLYLGWLAAYDADVARRYWKEYLEGYAATASLPYKADAGSGHGAQRELEIAIDEPLIDGLNRVAAGRGLTLNHLVRTAWAIVLSHLAERGDVVFGGVVSGRPESIDDVESIVGLFINTLPVRFRIDGPATFVALAERARIDAIESAPHQYVALTDVQSLTPLKEKLFDHIIVFENYPLDEEIAGGLTGRDDFSIEEVGFRSAEVYSFVLTVILAHRKAFVFSYDDARYDARTVEAASTMLLRLLEHAVATPDATVAELLDRTAPKPPVEMKKGPRKERKSIRSLKETSAKTVALQREAKPKEKVIGTEKTEGERAGESGGTS